MPSCRFFQKPCRALRTAAIAAALLLAMATPAAGINRWVDDPNCVAAWNFESGDFYTPTHVEVDPESDITFPSQYKMEFTSLRSRYIDAYVYWDRGVDYFSGDFTHKFIFYPHGKTLAHTFFWMVANDIDDAKGLADAGKPCIGMLVYNGVISLWMPGSGSDATATLTMAVYYYITVTRDDDAGANGVGLVTAYLCTGAHYGEAGATLVDTLQVDVAAGQQFDFRYLYCLNTYNTGTSTYYLSGSVQDIYLEGVRTPRFTSMLLDAKGDNDLYEAIDANTTDYRQGAASGDFPAADAPQLWLGDSLLDSGFPCKGGESNTSFSLVCWAKPVYATTRHILGKSRGASAGNCFKLDLDTYVRASIGYNTGIDWEQFSGSATLTADRWYHIGFTYDGGTKAWKLRVWDDTAGSVVDTSSGTGAQTINVEAMEFWIGTEYGSNVWEWDGLLDEVVIFNDVLTNDEIDQIRGETHPPGFLITVHEDDE